MNINFDNMRVQMVENFNRIVSGLNAHITDGELKMNEYELIVLDDRLNDLRTGLICLACMSGENETFSEVCDDDMSFASLEWLANATGGRP